jgi:hypothetical protein
MLKIAAVSAGVAVMGAAHATVIFSEDFESFPIGDLAGNITNGQTWTVDTGNEFKVANNRSSGGGTKSARVDSNDSSTYGYLNLPSAFNGSGPNNVLRTSVDIWMDAGLSGATTYGLAVFSGPTTRIGGIRAYGSGTRVDLHDGANWNIAAGATAPPGQWFTVRVDAVYSSPGNGVLRYFINNLQVGADQAITGSIASVRLYQFATVFPLTSNANYDNFAVEAVPEPASLAALGLGAFLMRRRKK